MLANIPAAKRLYTVKMIALFNASLPEDAIAEVLKWVSTKSFLVKPGTMGMEVWNGSKKNASSLWVVNKMFYLLQRGCRLIRTYQNHI